MSGRIPFGFFFFFAGVGRGFVTAGLRVAVAGHDAGQDFVAFEEF